jgi:uncharacterized membrane-anchored protein YhcB (DUF1043 family)
MFSQIFILFALVAAIFLVGVSVGQLLLRLKLEKLEALNLQRDEERLEALTRAMDSRAIVVEQRGENFERTIRNEINEIISGIENPRA